jgi:transposase
VRRFVCENPDCAQRSFDERFEGIGRGGASEMALGFFADLARGRATAAVARDLGVPSHYLRLAVGERRRRATAGRCGRLGRHLAIDECAVRRSFVYATVFSDPERGVVIDVAPGRDAAAIWAFSGLYSRSERAQVQIVSMDCHVPYRYMVRLVFPHALIVADAGTAGSRSAGQVVVASVSFIELVQERHQVRFVRLMNRVAALSSTGQRGRVQSATASRKAVL